MFRHLSTQKTNRLQHSHHRRCLTLPSRGGPKGCAFRSPLMSNVRRHTNDCRLSSRDNTDSQQPEDRHGDEVNEIDQYNRCEEGINGSQKFLNWQAFEDSRWEFSISGRSRQSEFEEGSEHRLKGSPRWTNRRRIEIRCRVGACTECGQEDRLRHRNQQRRS